MDTIAEFKIDVDDYPGGVVESYGVGVANTPYDAVYVGRGRSELDAAGDAMEIMAQALTTTDRWGMDRISDAIGELSDSREAAEEAEADCFREFCVAEGLVVDTTDAQQRFYDLSDDTFELSAALYVRFGSPDSKEEALARFLDIAPDDVSERDWDHYGADVFDAGGLGEYIVCNDDEAGLAVRDYITESLWAFRPEFLASYMPDDVGADVLRILQTRCEDSNGAIKTMVGDRFDELVEDAIGADGRGHFLAGYDGSESEVDGPDGETLYVYRVN